MPRCGSFVRGLLALGVVAVPAIASAQLPGYSASTGKYRVESQLKITQSMMGQTQEIENASKQLLSIALAGSAPALDLTMVVDSISMTASMPGAAPDMSALMGMKLTGKISPAGAISGEKAMDKAGAEPQSPVAQSLKTLFPRIKPGAKVGESWVDTTTAKANQNGIETTTTTITTYTYAADTSAASGKAAKITAVATAKVAGKGNAQGQELSLEGETKSTSAFLVATSGTFLGGTSDIEASINVTVEAMGMVIPITQKGTNKVERLP
ncbi:MAG: hypothetical protein MUF53_04345 [Gemmatimonadaceae bacterium]|nr:hypothetical protein [Gemmatimonadaceae bacterium]